MSSFQKNGDLESFVKFWNQTEGRDKLSKCLQYGSRFIAWKTQNHKDISQRFYALYKTTSDSRKIFRLGKFLNEYIKIKSILNVHETDMLLKVSNILSRGSYLMYWIFDGLTILSKIKFIRFDVTKITKRAAFFWFLGLVFGLLFEIYMLKKHVEREMEILQNRLLPNEGEKTEEKKKMERNEMDRQIAALQLQKKNCYLNIVKNCGDLVTASSMLGIPEKLIGVSANDGVIGIAGFISAYIAAMQLYYQ